MKINKYFKTAIFSVAIGATITSCVKSDDWETPPIVCNNRFDASTITMADFVKLAPATGTYKVPTDGAAVIFDAYVISSDESGNFYKTISIQDKAENPTVGLSIEIDKGSNYADFPVGSHVRIKANGLVLGLDRGSVKIGSVDPQFAIGRIPSVLFPRYIAGVCNGNGMEIATIVPTKLNTLAEAANPKYINTLVTVPDVQFGDAEVLPTPKAYINYIAGIGQDTNRDIIDKSSNKSIIRVSGFSTFGATLLPKESGDLTFVVSRFNTTWQMLIRNLSDVNFKKPRNRTNPPKGGTDIKYLGSFTEDFESYPAATSAPFFNTFPKYVNDGLLGDRYWEVRSFSNNKYIQLSANAAQGNVETYFIVPVDFTAANSFSFRVNAGFDTGKALTVLTATNYTPLGDITTATLTDITSSFTIPTGPASGYGTLAPAGTYNFPTALTGNGYIVFKYKGSNPGVTTTIQIDDIVVK